MALGTVLPFWPALLFTYLEPISLYEHCYTIVYTQDAKSH